MKLFVGLFCICLSLQLAQVDSEEATTTTTTKAATTSTMTRATTSVPGATVMTTGVVTTAVPTTSIAVTTSTTAPGDCVGNDSRCKGSQQGRCNSLEAEGSDCRWQIDFKKPGSCEGNDSRCAGSAVATCIRLSAQGSDCRWEDPSWTSGPSGKCLGNDSRCGGSSERACIWLSQDGADCKWRAAFKVTGNVSLIITTNSSNKGIITTNSAGKFANSSNASSAVASGFANVTGVSKEYVDVDLFAGTEGRRLVANALPTSASSIGEVTATYAISVPADAPASETATGQQVGDQLQPTNIRAIEEGIASSVAESIGGGTYHISVQSVTAPRVVVAESSSLSGAQAVHTQHAFYILLFFVLAASSASSASQ